MLDSVQDAWRLIEREIPPAAPAEKGLPLALCDGLVSTTAIHATGDSPPFDKSLMDGYAIRFDDYAAGRREFDILEEVTAGNTATRELTAGGTIRIMTGAPLPTGADCVIPVELVTSQTAITVTLDAPKARAEGNLARQGQAIRKGDLVLPAGTVLGPAQLGALAEMGVSSVLAIPRPSVSIVATGDELVPYEQVPGPGQIRNSNEIMLVTQARRAGAAPVQSTIARDTRADLMTAIREGLKSDFLVLSGGVSAGVLDLVPSVLAECGCEQVFHGCNVKPGKPIWFGRLTAERSPDGRPHWIFGLPGNPVSSMVCFELFVRMGIHRRRGIQPSQPLMHSARLTAPHVSRDSRPTYFPAVITPSEQGFLARPLAWQGSFDLQTVALANGFVLFETATERQAGEEVPTLILDR
ncbi:Molybdopterin molybdenumtransferase [Caulifigura coniformis]|uniref:Molybdopterin molybdenumtransferase n=1 Tax=Caulifigura coniformis TaxID=2527983 RepID=A0A517SJM3_9PLAN|nr:gephyrin-like molybdotransferase Glp [Caulifigura coniformis]QDT56324.1 Molybdopterin molybdenumtransferase [Caulifigura coniformis]